MAQLLTLTPTLTITDGGVTVVEREPSEQVEVEDFTEITFRVANAGTKLVCIEGSEGAEASPISLTLAQITALFLDLDVQVQVTFEGADTAIPIGPGLFAMNKTNLSTILFTNSSGSVANIKAVVAGERS